MRRCKLEGERSDVVELTVLRLHAFLWSRAVLCVPTVQTVQYI